MPNVTNSINVRNVNCDANTDSMVDVISSNTIIVIPTANLTRSFPFVYEPRFLSYSPVAPSTIGQIRFYLIDSVRRPVDFNTINCYIDIFL